MAKIKNTFKDKAERLLEIKIRTTALYEEYDTIAKELLRITGGKNILLKAENPDNGKPFQKIELTDNIKKLEEGSVVIGVTKVKPVGIKVTGLVKSPDSTKLSNEYYVGE